MYEFINDEIDMVLENLNDDLEEGQKEIVLTDEQREKIFEALRDGYDYIWEDIYNAISDEIDNVRE